MWVESPLVTVKSEPAWMPPHSLAVASAQNYDAVANPLDWIHRRVESISFTERLTVQRRISVDFTIKEQFSPFIAGRDSEHPSLYFLPIALLRKWPPLMQLDLRTAEGDPIPLLTTGKNREIDAAVLRRIA